MKEKLLTVEEVSKILRVSTRTVIRYIKAGRLQASKIGVWRINKNSLDDFLEETSNITKENKV